MSLESDRFLYVHSAQPGIWSKHFLEVEGAGSSQSPKTTIHKVHFFPGHFGNYLFGAYDGIGFSLGYEKMRLGIGLPAHISDFVNLQLETLANLPERIVTLIRSRGQGYDRLPMDELVELRNLARKVYHVNPNYRTGV
ncbi:hypothetical protein BVX95_01345 [archaeon D22]|nr:hypothetical protein BVX95_01345 [archaeon D22]